MADLRAPDLDAGGALDLRQWLPVLLLHRVVERAPRKNPHLLYTSVAYLDWMLGWLRERGWRVVPLQEAVQTMRGPEPPSRMVALTFDDGYRDFLTNALPVLQAHGCPATIFAVSGLLGEANEWDEGYMPGAPLMTAAELRRISACGIDVGSHGATHRHLTGLPSQERGEELARSKHDLESLLQRRVRWFAYPFLDQDEGLRAEVAAAGYEAAFGGEQGLHERFAVHRIAIGEPPERWLDLKLRGALFRARGSLPLRTLSRLRRQMHGPAGPRR